VSGFDLRSVPLLDHHSHAGLYERRLGRHQSRLDLDTRDPHYATSAYAALLREAYADLYGAESDWSTGVDAQYADGIEPAYTRMLDRLAITATLWDFRRLTRAGWPRHRYRLIYWIDPFVCPFPAPGISRVDELQAALAEALSLAGLETVPVAFQDFLTFVDLTLERARPDLVGLKLLLGYHRRLTFQEVDAETASAAFEELRHGRLDRYLAFQDFMVRYLFRAAGQLELPLQVHASFGGPASGLRLAHNDPALLESLLAQPDASNTRVVLLHGGYPFISQAAALAFMHANVYIDFSVLPSIFAQPLARWLEEWLELLPGDKVLFGSDASSPELYYTAAVNGRRQLGRALDVLAANGVLNRAEAVLVAERVCLANAVSLYGLSGLT
jgi:hypothetical protein